VSAGIALAFAIGVTSALYFRPEPPRLLQVLSVLLPEGAGSVAAPALSPDSTRLAFVATLDGRMQLWVRDLDSSAARPIAGSEGASSPFWSPDSQFVAFHAQGKIHKVLAAGGPIEALCDSPQFNGGSWSRDGVILFSPDQLQPLWVVPAGGGTPSTATTLDVAGGEVAHSQPVFLPDGRHFLYSATGPNADESWIRVGRLGSPESRPVVKANFNANYVATPEGDYVLFIRDRVLMAQSFDAASLSVRGAAVPLSDDSVALDLTTGTYAGGGHFTATDRMLAYVPGSKETSTRLTWHDRSGRAIEETGPTGEYEHIELSPDGSQAAIGQIDPRSSSTDIYILDLRNRLPLRLTFQPGRFRAWPRWAPDGQRVIFSGDGPSGIYVKPSTGGTEEVLLQATDSGGLFPTDWSTDGKFIVFRKLQPGTTGALWVFSLADRTATPLPQAESRGTNGRFSPDGHWIAYTSHQSGKPEIFVQPFPPTGAKFQVSPAGGVRPRWRRDGRELYYVASAGGALVAVSVIPGTTWQTGGQTRLFDVRFVPRAVNAYPYDVSPDGKRFLVITPPPEAEAPIVVVQNWSVPLRK
jgi:eukaryotic-like serine/threonine-protein kinase